MRSRIRVEGSRGPTHVMIAEERAAAGERLALPRPALALLLPPLAPGFLALSRSHDSGGFGEDGRLLALCFPEGLRPHRESLGLEGQGLGLVLDPDSWPEGVLAPSAEELERAAGRLADLGREASARDPEAPLALRLALLSFLLGAQRMLRSPARASRPAAAARGSELRGSDALAGEAGGPWSVEQAHAWVGLHYAETISFPRLVERCATNAGDFSRRFKELAGRPLFEEVNRLRIRRACQLLREGEDPVTEIAFAVGYNSLSFFNRYFRRLVGTSPSAYRREHRAG